jgi:predicted metal-dependent hydrolase
MTQASLPFDPLDVVRKEAADRSPTYPAPVFVRHRRARRYVVRVREDGSVRVTIPRGGSKREAAVADAQRPWIERQRVRLEEARAAPSTVLATGDERAWRARAIRELPDRLRTLAAEHGLVVTRVSVRNQRWRWGSCSPRGHICLNWRLVLMPSWVRDYVLLHELMHLKRLDHSPRFWKLVAAACPNYQQARAWLGANAERLASTPHWRLMGMVAPQPFQAGAHGERVD